MARGRSQASEPDEDKTASSTNEASEGNQQVGARVPAEEGETSLGATAAGTESPAGKDVQKDSDPDNDKAPSVSTVYPAQYDADDKDFLPAQARD